jgi:hypothetical protein
MKKIIFCSALLVSNILFTPAYSSVEPVSLTGTEKRSLIHAYLFLREIYEAIVNKSKTLTGQEQAVASKAAEKWYNEVQSPLIKLVNSAGLTLGQPDCEPFTNVQEARKAALDLFESAIRNTQEIRRNKLFFESSLQTGITCLQNLFRATKNAASAPTEPESAKSTHNKGQTTLPTARSVPASLGQR